MVGATRRLLAVAVACSMWAAVAADPAPPADPPAVYACTFAEGGWDRADWILASRPDWDHEGNWIQRPEYIENEVPADATEDEMVSKRAKETYTSMLYKERLEGDVTIRSKMAFAHRMAPSIVLTSELGPADDKGRRTHLGHFEIVLFDEGINVWRHEFKDGRARWEKRAYARFRLEKDTEYELSVTKKGKLLIVAVGEHPFAYHDELLPDTFWAGITGAEGVNRFYDFALTR
ncbi:MAG: hypothetical protein JXR94_12455 [Candidatus Hydrogenedentes bacterium]|nr:hypothetical protein [Candidatus Hydrogenedentota bacterium]